MAHLNETTIEDIRRDFRKRLGLSENWVAEYIGEIRERHGFNNPKKWELRINEIPYVRPNRSEDYYIPEKNEIRVTIGPPTIVINGVKY